MAKEEKKENKIIKKKTRVTVSNTLNQMIFEQKDMNLQAFRMVMFYLAKINPKRPEFTEVKVSLESYAEMLGVELNEKAIDESTNLLMGYVLKTGEKIEGNYRIINAKYNIFSVCRLVERLSDGKRMLEFKCSEDIKPLIFELKEKFTPFKVWNVLNLGNFQDIRMYMMLSQYKVAGKRTLTIEEIKYHLGIDEKAYPQYKEFARTVLKKCQLSLKERTDICFEFKAVGRPAHSVLFEIYPNESYRILKYLEDSGIKNDIPEISAESSTKKLTEGDKRRSIFDENKAFYGAFDMYVFDEFSNEDIELFIELAKEHLTSEYISQFQEQIGKYSAYDSKELRFMAAAEYIHSQIKYVNASRVTEKGRMAYLRLAIRDDYAKVSPKSK